MKNSAVLLFKEREIQAMMPFTCLKKKKSVGRRIVTVRGQGECNGHFIIMLVAVLIKIFFLELICIMYIRSLKSHLFVSSNFASKHPF